ncbi:MAG: RsbRD N-terminal domain-containing protein [Desulfovibrionaceae bacterium]
MNTLTLFREHRQALVKAWIDEVYTTYPLDTTGFMRTQEDAFCNPVGEITTTMAGYLYDAVAGEHIIEDRVRDSLDRFVKLRSVQDFSPSQGIGVFYLLKPLLRKVLLPKFTAAAQLSDYLEAESRLDTLALMAFDVYISTREKLAEMRIKEIKDQHVQLVRWAQHVEGSPVGGPGGKNF